MIMDDRTRIRQLRYTIDYFTNKNNQTLEEISYIKTQIEQLNQHINIVEVKALETQKDLSLLRDRHGFKDEHESP